MSRWTRLTLVGSARRADVVVPSDEGFAAMLPPLLDLLDEQPDGATGSVSLVRVTGEQVDLAQDCLAQELRDGEVLRVVRAAQAPPPPEVADVTDATAEELAARADRWDTRSRHATAATTAAVAAGLLGAALLTGLAPAAGAALVGGLLLVAVLAAALLGRLGRTWAGLVLTTTALGLAVPLGLAAVATGLLDLPDAAWAVALQAWVTLGLAVGVGRSDRGALAGATVGVLLSGAHLTLGAVLPSVQVDAVVAVAAVVVVGLLPGYALAAAGLTRLDDAVMDGGRTPPRERVRRTLDEAYRALTWSALAVAVALAPAAGALLRHGDGGALALGVVVLLVAALRTRGLPLRAQAGAVWAAVVVAAAVLLLGRLEDAPALVAVVAAVGGLTAAVTAGLTPSGQQRARLRRLGDRVELLAVLAVVPLLLGVFGVYGSLLEVF